MKYYIKIFGCQMNYSDAERISTILEKYKLKKAASTHEADFVIFVTCGVRQSAENRVYGLIHNINKKHPAKKIILTGCLAHRKDVQRRLRGKVVSFTTIKDFPKKIKKILNTKYKIQDTKRKPCNDYLEITPRYTNPHTAYVPIMTGCNNFCAYCVVPCARGREYSRPAEDILKEVKNLIKKGYKEIILLGQNVNSYKSKIQYTKYKMLDTKKFAIEFSDLLMIIDNIPGNFWITFLTSHPKDMSVELIDIIAKSEKICEYISLPVQSGDDNVLKKMNRHYTVAHYKNLISKIRAAYKKYKPQITPMISTDIIIGFPSETKKQFENTANLFRAMKFDMAYVSQYSPRPETAAWRLKDNVSKKEKVRREKVLTDILAKTALANNKKYIGEVIEVLVDKRFDLEEFQAKARKEKIKPCAAKYLAHTRTQKKVIFYSNKKIPVGSFQKVKITEAKTFGLEGKNKLS
jgi:tRNA-2-methylthio-N6-dimethylallyladenosine synthase